MTLGEKIKAERTKKNITQSMLAGNKITRNMLSLIENGIANPSLDTIKYIADELSLPISYLLSDSDDLLFYEKQFVISDIYKAYRAKSYQSCINKISKLSGTDDELAYILSSSHFEMGKITLMRGELFSAKKHFTLSKEFSEKTSLNTSHITDIIPMYICVCENIQAPLLNFEPKTFEANLISTFDFEFYNYLTQNTGFKFNTEAYQLHMDAKNLIKGHAYSEAIQLLLRAVEITKTNGYNAYLLFTAYSDLEICYKQLYDFENAYLYSNKRMSLIEGFKS